MCRNEAYCDSADLAPKGTTSGEINRGFYFFEVNTKYISSNVLKISEISRVRSTSEIADIFNT